MLVWKKDKEDDVLVVNKRGYGDRDEEVLRVDGKTGAVSFSKAVTLPAGMTISLAAGDVGTTELAALAVTAAKLAANAVETAKINNLAVTTGKLAADAVDGTKLADDAVDSEHIADGAIDPAHFAALAVETAAINNLAVTNGKLAAAAVTKAKAAVFASTEQTATGAAQNVAHGLGAVPALVLVIPTEGHDGAGAAGTQMPDIAEGAHDATNVVVTVSNGAKFKVFAWA